MDMLHISGLRKRFGEKEVLRGLDLAVPEKSIFGFVGRNGAGKTTTMKLVLGLMKPDAGEITVAGEPVRFGQTPTNRHIGYLPDVPEFYPFMTAPEYLRFCGEISGLPRAETERRAHELLEMVGLGQETHRIRGFSRGMKQRLGIAQELLNRPRLLICDEPTSALDPVGRKEILDILLAVREQTTVLFSTHILADVERICTDVAFLEDGVLALQGKLAEVKNRFRTDAYLLEPETPADMAALRMAFPQLAATDAGQLILPAEAAGDVLRFIADHGIRLTKLEKQEPSLERLFMEVTNR
ncbi:MAG: ABC transporter ATP-binding protein [Clostridia bacterium]|nr:ABC transporter ATP-binding protein [Clostridia bacterium]